MTTCVFTPPHETGILVAHSIPYASSHDPRVGRERSWPHAPSGIHVFQAADGQRGSLCLDRESGGFVSWEWDIFYGNNVPAARHDRLTGARSPCETRVKLMHSVRRVKRTIIPVMNRHIVYGTVGILVLIGAWWVLDGDLRKDQPPQQETSARDYMNAAYIVDGRPITLTNGVSAIEAAPGSASTIVTRYFGNELRKDVDGDGREDIVFLLTQATGGSGTFFYVVAALQTPAGM
jgi:hypothetical protein